jgi:hypothetical protein
VLNSLWACATHIVVDMLPCDRSWVRLNVSCHDEKKQGKGQKAQGVVVADVFVRFFVHVIIVEFIGDYGV